MLNLVGTAGGTVGMGLAHQVPEKSFSTHTHNTTDKEENLLNLF